MAFLKYLLPYTVGVLAIIYIQSDFAHAADSCYFCDSQSSNSCSASELDNNAQANIIKCNTTNGGLCGGITFTYNNTKFVSRICNVNCSVIESYIPYSANTTHIGCKSCNETLCNTFEISGASSSIGISLVSLLSVIVALYSL